VATSRGGLKVNRRFRSDLPKCVDGHYHQWKKGEQVFGETGICARCGYDQFERSYRVVPKKED